MSQNPRDKIGFELARASRLWRTKLDEALAPLGLTQAKWLILVHLSKIGRPMPQKELAESIGVEGPTVVRVLDGLERKGLIERRAQQGDRRTKVVHLTPQAETVLEDIIRIAAGVREDILAGISDAELTVCERAVSVMLHNMGFDCLKMTF
jgi:MarR family transcriptional regulator, transcriptional regulator for hemolysin